MKSFGIALLGVLLVGTAASAQSLGDVARKEQQRRKTTKTAGKVYTNKDLGPGGEAPAPASTPATPPASQVAGPGGPESKPTPPPTEDDQDPRKTEEYWRTRVQTAQAEISRNELFLDALQSRVVLLDDRRAPQPDVVDRGLVLLDVRNGGRSRRGERRRLHVEPEGRSRRLDVVLDVLALTLELLRRDAEALDERLVPLGRDLLHVVDRDMHAGQSRRRGGGLRTGEVRDRKILGRHSRRCRRGRSRKCFARLSPPLPLVWRQSTANPRGEEG